MGEEPERLRARAAALTLPTAMYPTNMEYAVPGTSAYAKEAAKLIPALLAEVERLAGERDTLRGDRARADAAAGTDHTRAVKAEMECERLAGRVAALTEALTEARPYVEWMTFQGDNEDARQAHRALAKIDSALADVGGSE